MAVRALWCPYADSNPSIRATSVCCKMPGSSQSFLIGCNDGYYYVMKANLNPVGPYLLSNECLAAHLMHSAGLPSPPTRSIYLSKAFLKANPSLRLESRVGSQCINDGLHFGSRFVMMERSQVRGYLPNGYDRCLINRSDSLGSYIFDTWAQHRDAREFVFERHLGHSRYEMFTIDNSHMFGGPSRNTKYRPGEMVALDRRVYKLDRNNAAIDRWCSLFQRLLPPELDRCASFIPGEWYSGDLDSLLLGLTSRLKNIRNLFSFELAASPFFHRSATDHARDSGCKYCDPSAYDPGGYRLRLEKSGPVLEDKSTRI